MKNKLLLLWSIFIFYSCGSTSKPRDIYRYTSPSFGSVKSYTVKPVYVDKKESAIYIATAYSKGEHYQNRNQYSDLKKSASLAIHRSVTDKHYNFHYGLGAVYGEYEFNNEIDDLMLLGEKKGFYGFNLKGGINYNISTKKVDYRLFGLEMGYHYANGDYQEKINKFPIGDSASDSYYNIGVNNPRGMFSFNISTELVFKLKNHTNFSFGIYSGKTLLKSKKSDDVDFKINPNFGFAGLTGSLTIKNITISILSESAISKRESIRIKNIKYGLTYRIPNIKKQ